MMARGAIWLWHGAAFAVGLAVLFAAGEVGQTLFAGLKIAPLLWHLVIAALAVGLACLAYALVLRWRLGWAMTPVALRGFALSALAFCVMAGLIYAGLSVTVSFAACAALLFALSGARLARAL